MNPLVSAFRHQQMAPRAHVHRCELATTRSCGGRGACTALPRQLRKPGPEPHLADSSKSGVLKLLQHELSTNERNMTKAVDQGAGHMFAKDGADGVTASPWATGHEQDTHDYELISAVPDLPKRDRQVSHPGP